ncbi:MAG: glycosyltransferase family 4 protein [Alphaproteobacteria bacterium]|nr:glycosyltransferase family 4 protein [Alphaproteobacteria bacterium]
MRASIVRRAAYPRPAGADRARLRLLHVFPSFSIGGIQRQFAYVAGALGATAEHLVIALDGRTEALAMLPSGVLCDVVDPPSLPEDGPLARLRSIRSCLRRTGASLVLTYNWGAIEWCLANRLFGTAPGLHSEHGFGPDETERPLRRRSRFRRLALGGTVPLVVPSTTLMHVATEDWGFPETQLRFVPNGVDVEAIERRVADAAGGVVRRGDEIVLGCVAPLRPEKNLARLLRCFAAVATEDPRWRLVVAGDGPERGRLEIVAQQLAIRHRVQFLGWVDDPAPMLGSVDIAALSSDTEQAPFSVLESGATARPLVATDVGDIRDLVSPGNQPFVVARDAEDDFVAALRRLGGDAALRRQVGEANRDHVAANFAAARMVDGFCAAMDEALARSPDADRSGVVLRIEPLRT